MANTPTTPGSSSGTTPSTPSTSDVDRLKRQVRELRDDLQELGLLAKGAAREKAHEARDVMRGYYDDGRERFDEYEDQLTDYVRAKPFQSILAAIGVGFLLSLFLGRR